MPARTPSFPARTPSVPARTPSFPAGAPRVMALAGVLVGAPITSFAPASAAVVCIASAPSNGASGSALEGGRRMERDHDFCHARRAQKPSLTAAARARMMPRCLKTMSLMSMIGPNSA